MFVEKFDIDFDDKKDKMSLCLNLFTDSVSGFYGLEKMVRRIDIFKRRFKRLEPQWYKTLSEDEFMGRKRTHKFEYGVFDGSEFMPDALGLCDLTIIQDGLGEEGTSVDAVFNYNVADSDDLHDYYKMLSLFCRFCFKADLNYSKPVLDQLDSFWPKIVNVLDYRRAVVEEMVDGIISENDYPASRELALRERNYPVVIYKKKNVVKNDEPFDVDELFVKWLADSY